MPRYGFDHIHLRSPELDATAAWFQDKLGAEVVRLRKTSTALREELTALRATDVPDAHLINRAMLAELEALRAERSAESAELAAILAELEPLTAAAKSED